MEIHVGSLPRDASDSRGVTIIIDVFRAFTTAAIAFDRGAIDITLVSEADDALTLYQAGYGDLLMGEVNGEKPTGFELGNSPHEAISTNFKNKHVVQSTRNGTVGANAAAGTASHILLGSFVVANATVSKILKMNPEHVSIIAMGEQGVIKSDEDEQCAFYLRNLLEGRKPNTNAIKDLIKTSGAVQKFYDTSQPQYLPEDVDWALKFNHFDFAMEATKNGDHLVARKTN
jgi:2-phosphosulfolactate phosphatase